MAACDVCLNGDLTTIAFLTSGFTAEFTSIGGNEITREIVDATTLGLETCRAKCPGDRIDYGETELEFCHDSDQQPPFAGDPEQITITFPPKSGQTSGGTYSGTGWIRRYKQGDAVPDERMLAEATIVWDCTVVPIFTPGS